MKISNDVTSQYFRNNGGTMNINMMKQALEMRSKLQKVQKELGKLTVEGESGKGAVKVVANGQQEVISLKIDPSIINPAKAEELERLVLKAVANALEKAKDLATEEMKKITGGLNIPGLT
jgi:nucleoid-associated protein EbfC